MSKPFSEVEVGEKFQVEGSDVTWEKVDEEWREPYCPTNCQDESGLGAWVNEWQPVLIIK